MLQCYVIVNINFEHFLQIDFVHIGRYMRNETILQFKYSASELISLRFDEDGSDEDIGLQIYNLNNMHELVEVRDFCLTRYVNSTRYFMKVGLSGESCFVLNILPVLPSINLKS